MDKDFLVAYDLYLLRYVVENDWFEVHDILRDYLRKKGHTVKYSKDDLFYDNQSMKSIVVKNEK